MNKVNELLRKYNYKTKKILLLNNIKIIDTDSGRIVLKEKKDNDLRELFKYLKSKKFYNYLDYINSDNDDYVIYPYIDTVVEENNQKIKDLAVIVAILHSKTQFYRQISLDEIKKIYEEYIENLDNLESYYENLRITLEEIEFLSPSYNYLLTNISWIFHSINSSKYFFNKWYELLKDKKNKRVCLIHGDLKLDHFLNNENKYFISWKNARNDSPVYDLYILYKNEYKNVLFYDVLNYYEEYNQLSIDEKYLLFSLILTPIKLDFDKSEVINTKNVYELISYLKQSSDIVSKYQPSDPNSKSQKQEE